MPLSTPSPLLAPAAAATEADPSEAPPLSGGEARRKRSRPSPPGSAHKKARGEDSPPMDVMSENSPTGGELNRAGSPKRSNFGAVNNGLNKGSPLGGGHCKPGAVKKLVIKNLKGENIVKLIVGDRGESNYLDVSNYGIIIN